MSFNVRGFNHRWNEVVLLSSSLTLDVIILVETGIIDIMWMEKLFPDHSIFYQKGENSFGGVVIIIRRSIPVKRIDTCLPNVCVLDLVLGEKIRIIGIYAPESKSWNWSDLTNLISNKCILLGDFNVDLNNDTQSSEALLEWADTCSLAPCTPSAATSLRSNRTIDYALSNGVPLSIQTYEGGTSSDHKPILSTLPGGRNEQARGKNTHWNVFSLFLAYVFKYWQEAWTEGNLNETYKDYVSFLSLLISRCTVDFPLNKYRIALPITIRAKISKSRAISFRAKRTGDIETRRLSKSLRESVREEITLFRSNQLRQGIATRFSPAHTSAPFWSRTKRLFKPTNSSLHAFLLDNGEIVKDRSQMVDIAAEHYKQLYSLPTVMRPHPYVDAPAITWENDDELIPSVTFEEVTK
ncbi:unnamed protein product, partial [Rotaria magnacalcarata]